MKRWAVTAVAVLVLAGCGEGRDVAFDSEGAARYWLTGNPDLPTENAVELIATTRDRCNESDREISFSVAFDREFGSLYPTVDQMRAACPERLRQWMENR